MGIAHLHTTIDYERLIKLQANMEVNRLPIKSSEPKIKPHTKIKQNNIKRRSKH